MDTQHSKRTSVILPTFNRKHLLQSSLDAVLAQVDERDEVIVVDDGSGDGTNELLTSYGNRVDTIFQANAGKAKALNAGLRRAQGRYVWIVDDDDIVCPKAHHDLLALFGCNPDADIAYGRHRRFRQETDGSVQLIDTGYWNDCPADDLFVATLEDFFVHQPGMLVRRSLYRTAGDFDEALPRSIDYEMLIRLARHGRAVSTDKVIFHQRLHDGDRGPAAGRLKARDRDANWVAHDAHIFERLHATLPLESYLPHRELSNPEDHRRALLQRGTIMARKKNWQLAIADFDLALRESAAPLSRPEKLILRRATGSKYGCDEAVGNRDIDADLAALREKHVEGGALSRSLARGLVWRVRHALIKGDLREGLRFAEQAARWAIG
ncbi:glycosyltransferase [Tabrizicola sp.]|uniref:glycosyltransferase n=1 Tax=Tabrizicola sp. TaxID=2005166 RepID=UPI003F349270